jgi:hypothetical protein
MMRSVLRATALAVGVGATVAVPGAAWAEGEYVRLTPSTIQAGFQDEIEAFCGDEAASATVTSDAFGLVTLKAERNPVTGQVLLKGIVTIPRSTKPGSYQVLLRCPSQELATTTVFIVTSPMNSRGPHTGGGGLAHDDNNNLMIGAGSAAAALGALLFVLARRRRAGT